MEEDEEDKQASEYAAKMLALSCFKSDKIEFFTIFNHFVKH